MTVTGATGLIGPRAGRRAAARAARRSRCSRATRRGPHAARAAGSTPVEAFAWDLLAEPAPAQALDGRDAVVHLAGETVAQRWSAQAKRAIRESRVTGTRNLLAGLRAGREPRPRDARELLGDRLLRRARRGAARRGRARRASDFLAERLRGVGGARPRGAALGMRVVLVRTGVVLDRHGGALAKMLPPFRLGVGGPVAGGRQYISGSIATTWSG